MELFNILDSQTTIYSTFAIYELIPFMLHFIGYDEGISSVEGGRELLYNETTL